jgi:transcriptional regulator with XRE-family HTH domain
MAADRARVEAMRRSLGAHLAMYRMAAGVSQPQLGQVIDRTRSMVSKIENGRRGMPAKLWKITDDVCGAQGALIAEYNTLAQVEQDYRACCRARRRQVQQTAAQAEVDALKASPAPSWAALPVIGGDAWLDMTRGNSELAGELLAVITRLVQAVGRRDAMRMVGWMLAAVGLSGLDSDEYMRVAQAVQAPSRVDAKVINNLATTLAYCKRQEDQLGPYEVIDTVVAQHGLVHRLLEGGCPPQWRKSLSLVDSNMASAIGGYLIDMGNPEEAKRYFGHARQAAHHAGNPACAAYAAANTSFAARLRGDTPTALDTAAAARSLAARTNDARLKALAELHSAGAYALDGQYGPCMIACDRAHDFVASSNGSTPESLAYFVDHATLDSLRSTFLALLDKPREAVEAASNAQAQFDRSYVGLYALCEVRLGTALVLSKEISEAARVLGDVASQAHLFPRLAADLHAARTQLQPWADTQAVTTLDAQLHACGLLPTRPAKSTAPGLGSHRNQRA